MSDIATLGISVDSSQVKSGSTDLSSLSAAAKAATDALNALSSGVSRMPKINVGDSTESLRKQHQVLNAFKTDLALLGPQFGSVAGMASALYIENSHLAEGFGGLKKAIGEIVTPANILIGGFIGIAAGGAIALKSISDAKVALADLGDRSGTSLASIQALTTGMALKGVDSEDATKSLTTLSDETEKAQNHMGVLGDLLHANGIKAGTLVDNVANLSTLIAKAGDESRQLTELGLPATHQMVEYWKQGADAIRAATGAANQNGSADDALVAKTRAFTDQWNKEVVTLKTGLTEAFVKGIDYASQFGSFVDTMLTHVADVGGNKLKAAFAGSIAIPSTSLSATSDVSNLYPRGYDKLAGNAGNAGRGDNYLNKGSDTIDPVIERNNIALIQQRISALGQLAGVDQQVLSKELELKETRLKNGSQITDSDVSRIVAYTRAQLDGTLAIRTSAAAQLLEANAVGLGIGPSMAFKAVQEEINRGLSTGNPLASDRIALLTKEACALSAAAQKAAEYKTSNDLAFNTAQLGRTDTESQVASQLKPIYGDAYTSELNGAIAGQIRLNSALTETKSIGENAMTGLLEGFRDGKSGAQILRSELINLENSLFKLASNQMISAILKGATGFIPAPSAALAGYNPQSLSSLYHTGGVIGSDSVPSRSVHSEVFAGARRFHSGDIVPGEVPVIARSGEGIFTQAQMRALAPAGSGGNAVSVNVINNAPDTTVSASKRSDGGVDVHSIVISAVNDHVAKGGLDGAMRSRYGQQLQPRGR
jgi:hypothetical protein